MVVTNEKRHEIAAMLRDSSETRWLDFFDLARVFGIEEEYDDDGFMNMSDKVWLTLADFIEPEPERTCLNLGGEEGTNFEHYDFGCSACGYCCDLSEPNYCPNCSARVID